MKVLKDESEYSYGDFRELKCGACRKILWGKGQEIISNSRLTCPQCGRIYYFEPRRWRVLSETPV